MTNAEKKRNRYEALKALRRCAQCASKLPDDVTTVLCKFCMRKNYINRKMQVNEAALESYARRKAEGRCVNCGDIQVGDRVGKVQCRKCMDIRNAKLREKKANARRNSGS